MTQPQAPETIPTPEAGTPPGPPTTADDTLKGEFRKAHYAADLDAWLEHWKTKTARVDTRLALDETHNDTELALNEARWDADNAAEVASLKSIEDAYIEATKGSLDRALTRMNVVTASVGAITTIYTALLGLVYAAKADDGKPFEVGALMPALFLGMSLFLVTIYAAVFRKSVSVGPLLPSGIGGQINEIRLITFMRWCFAGVLARTWALNGGVVSLGIGIATLPIPFIETSEWLEWVVFGGGAALVLLTMMGSAGYFKNFRLFNWLREVLSPPALKPQPTTTDKPAKTK